MSLCHVAEPCVKHHKTAEDVTTANDNYCHAPSGVPLLFGTLWIRGQHSNLQGLTKPKVHTHNSKEVSEQYEGTTQQNKDF